MSLKSLFKSAVTELRKRNIPFAVAGGFAADLYRDQPRLTIDVDLVILVEEQALEIATSVIEAVGLKAGVVRRADLSGGLLFAIKRKSTEPCMVVGRRSKEPSGEGVDILLPDIPWVREAVLRAQTNEVDFGFGPVPALTVEDVLISKLYALQRANLRAKDLDDLQSIFATDLDLNISYLAGQISGLKIQVPDEALPLLPDELKEIVSDALGKRRRRS